jgi:RNA polymerase sigma-70 factor (ECF subfamily)
MVEHRDVWLASHVLPVEPALRGWLRKARHAEFDIDDIIQETYARLFQAPEVEKVVHVRAYVFRTAHSVVADRFRRKNVVAIADLADLENLANAVEVLTPEDHVGARNELRLLLDMTKAFPEKTRRVFFLSRIEGLSMKEVGRRTGIPVSTVEKHIARAFRLLMDAYASGGYSPPIASTRTAQRRGVPKAAGQESSGCE